MTTFFTDFVVHAVVLVPSLLLYIFTFFFNLINVSLVICSEHDVALGGVSQPGTPMVITLHD